MRSVYVLPNMFTSASLFSALASIIATSHGDFRLACYLILLSGVLDALDGPVARLTRATSSFGLQYDSLTDVVAFGVAPAFLMYSKLDSFNDAATLPGHASQMAMGVCALYVICGAIRLARFNIQVEDAEKRSFTGMPIPAAAAMLVSTFLIVEDFLAASRGLHRMLLIEMMLLAYLMVSTYPFASLKGIYNKLNKSLNGLITVVFLICLMIAFREFLPFIVLAGFVLYIALTLYGVARDRRNLRRYSPGAELSLEDARLDDEGNEEEDDERDGPG